jgi:hypothetical protein
MEGRSHPGAASCSLTLSEQELMRYRIMAAGAADNEAAEWLAAGVVPGGAAIGHVLYRAVVQMCRSVLTRVSWLSKGGVLVAAR